MQTITVLEFPPSESCKSRVNFELRYGTCAAFESIKALITLPSEERDKLIRDASLRRCPFDSAFDCRSLP